MIKLQKTKTEESTFFDIKVDDGLSFPFGKGKRTIISKDDYSKLEVILKEIVEFVNKTAKIK